IAQILGVLACARLAMKERLSSAARSSCACYADAAHVPLILWSDDLLLCLADLSRVAC
ncbi:hypothetical protein Dimus_022359, partial [Dionaea muscipula]